MLYAYGRIAGLILVSLSLLRMSLSFSYDYPKSGATGGVLLLRDGSTSTPTQEAFIAQYSELMDISPADQTIQYEAYLLYLNGMTVDELDAYYHINDDGQQEGGGAGATNVFRCCKDEHDSSGCQRVGPNKKRKCLHVIPDQTPAYECEYIGSKLGIIWAKERLTCCLTSPDSRVGSRFWAFSTCK